MKISKIIVLLIPVLFLSVGCQGNVGHSLASQEKVSSSVCPNCGAKGTQLYQCTKCGKIFCSNCEKKMQTSNNPSAAAHGICPNWDHPGDGHDFTRNL